MKNRTKRILFFIFLFFVLTIHGCDANKIDNQTIIYNTDTVKYAVEMIQPEGNLTFINANVKGRPVIFLLDSGAGSSVIDINQQDDYGLDVQIADSEFQGIGGSNKLYNVTNLNTITIDSSDFNISFRASNLSNVVSLIKDASGIEIIGILGSDFFTDHKVIFDYNKKIFFISEN